MLRALDLTKSYDGAPLFDGLSLTLNPGDRAGLVGPNGAGKSTLLRLLAGHERPDRGSITTAATIGYLPQEAPAGDATLDDLLHRALGEAGEALRALHAPGDLDAYAHALERAEATGAWAAEARAEEARRRLGIDHLAADRPLNRLSGGEQARALLAATLIEQPDVLLLDEPTNHLDADGLEWLEQFLGAFDGAILVVSHDRRFLDAVVTRIYDLGDDLAVYEGGYTAYRDEKHAAARAWRSSRPPRTSAAAGSRPTSPPPPATRSTPSAPSRAPPRPSSSATPRRSPRRRRRASTGSSARWRRPTGSSARATPPPSASSSTPPPTAAAASPASTTSARACSAMSTSPSTAASASPSPAPNGAGKTTLLQLLLGTLAPAHGTVETATTVRLLPQQLQAAGPLLPWFRRHARQGIEESEARTLLAHFGLDADAIHRPLERLSPGQRARAAIAALVASEADLLLLDEPTNHLDFDTLEVLETALAKTPSTIVAVSHDRWFLDAIGTQRRLHVEDGRLYEGSSTSSRE